MEGKVQITSERASSQKIIRLQDADNENKMAGKGQITIKSAISQKIIRLQDADNENKMAEKGQITSKRASSQKIIQLQDTDNENKMLAGEHSHGLSSDMIGGCYKTFQSSFRLNKFIFGPFRSRMRAPHPSRGSFTGDV